MKVLIDDFMVRVNHDRSLLGERMPHWSDLVNFERGMW